MDIFSVALEQSNIQCSLQACDLGEAQTASLISADSGLKGQRSIGIITHTDAKTEFRKIRKQWSFSIWNRPYFRLHVKIPENFFKILDFFVLGT